MRKSFFAVLFFVISCFSSKAADVKGKITGYGIVRASSEYQILQAPDTAARVSRLYGQIPVLTRVTDRIPAKLNTHFGMFFQVTHLPKSKAEIELVHVRKSPDMRRPDGTTSHGSKRVFRVTFEGGQTAASFLGFRFDHRYEIVPGKWTFEVTSKGRTLCKQDFYVLQE